MEDGLRTVWVLSSGEYSNWSIDGIFTTEALARAYVEAHKSGWRDDWNEPKEWVLDDGRPPQEWKQVSVRLDTGAFIESKGVLMTGEICRRDCGSWYLYAIGPTMERALKAARDYRARVLAERASVAD